MNEEGNLLKYGDCICLSSSQGFLCSQGFTRTNVFIQVHYSKSQTYQRNMRDFVFQIVPRLNYDAFKEYNKFKKEYVKASGGGVAGARSTVTQQDKIKLGNLTKKLQEEVAGNRKVFQRRMGEVVSYGDEIQLLHYDSSSFLEGGKNCAELDRSCYMIRLSSQGNKNVYFMIEPRYKYRNEGQSVNYGDVVNFKNVKSGNMLHISSREAIMPVERSKAGIEIMDPDNFRNVIQSDIDRRMLPDEFAAMYEVNTSSNASNFTIRPFRSYADELATEIIKGGQVVRLQHSESGGFISSDDCDAEGSFAEVFLWNYKGKPTDFEACSTQTYFELEIVDTVNSYLGRKTQYSGNSSNETAKSGGMHFRLRHLNTGRLVVMKPTNELPGGKQGFTVGLSEHLKMDIRGVKDKDGKEKCQLTIMEAEYLQQLEENSIFRLVSTGVDMSSGISANTSVQIQHVATGRFLQHFQRKQLVEDELIVPGSLAKGSEEGLKEQDSQEMIQDQEADQPELLDRELFQRIPEIGNLGTRDMLTLEENASFENAFFIAPETKETLAKVLFVHTSVNWLNSFQAEVSNRRYGESKDRQRKIQTVIEEMIFWLQTDEDSEMDSEQGRFIMDTPYSLRSNDEFARKQRNLKIKQKYMRELRVIECLVDLLHMPFASGQFNFMELKQEDAIIHLMQLCYRLLSQIVGGYRLNEMYTSQWIGIFLNHVLKANDDNAVGADKFIEQLCDENEHILEKMITTHLLEEFVSETDRGKEAPRSFSLLTALCATQHKTIRDNQNDIVSILLENPEAREKLLMPIRRLKKRLPIEVCFDLSQQRWYTLQQVCEMVNQCQRRLAKLQDVDQYAQLSEKDQVFMDEFNCFVRSLDLFAETCLDRNKVNQKKLAQYYENKLLIQIFTDEEMNFMIRSRSLRLYLESCLDIDPFQRLIVPSGQVVWKDLPSIEFQDSNELIQAITDRRLEFPIKFSRVRIPQKIDDLKVFMSSFLEQTKGVISPDEPEKNDMIISVLKAVKFMVSHGFYKSPENLSSIASKVVDLLNGSKGVKKYKPAPDEEVDSEFEEIMTRSRYFPENPEEATIQSKLYATEILLLISNLELDAKCNIFLAKLKNDIELSTQANNHSKLDVLDQKPGEQKQVSSTQEDLQLLSIISGQKGYESINEQQYVCILFDLLLYRYTELQAKVFNMLVNYFTRKRIMMECLTSTQILESSRSTQVLNSIKKAHSQLKTYYEDIGYWLTSHNQNGKETKESVSQIFEQLTRYCEESAVMMPEIDEEENELDVTNNQDKSQLSALRKRMTLAQDKQQQQKLELQYQRERQNRIEEFLIFDIDRKNATPNRENQRLLQSFDICDTALAIIKMRVDRTTNYAEEYKTLIRSCYRFLCAYVRGNFQNQLKVYDDVDVFMRDMDTYQAAVLLFYEIFKDNTKFLTLNVTKFIRSINNTAEEVSLNQIKKAINLKLLEVFCRYQSRLIKVNQSEIILQMTADISRSNVIYLFQAEGSKELGVHIDSSQVVHELLPGESQNVTQQNLTQHDLTIQHERSIVSGSPARGGRSQPYQQEGIQVMSVQIFNVIQLLKLITLCCNGKSPVAEAKCRENILDFKNAVRLIKTCHDFWPLKIALFDYIINAYFQSNDPQFMRKPTEEEQNEEDDTNDQSKDESDMGLLLQLIEVIIEDYEQFKLQQPKQTRLKFPNGKKIPLRELQQRYIYHTGLEFIKATLKRKTYDVGSVELKFYVVAKHIADVFYIAEGKEQQIAALELLKYIYGSPRHAKYLDNVKHPAKKGRQNKEILDSLNLTAQQMNQQLMEETQFVVPEVTNSNRLFQRITQLSYSHEMRIMKESEFTELVVWVTEVQERVQESFGRRGGSRKGKENAFVNVTYDNVVLALLRLLDCRQLNKELQIAGLSILRKIVEMENKESSMPAADWKTQQFIQYRKQIRAKQTSLIELGTIQFLCKHITEVEDPDIQEECLLVCISLIIGGNQRAQQTFFEFMREEDSTENKFMLTIKQILMQNFELTKKYMIEKNAKLEMVHKMKQRMQAKQEEVVGKKVLQQGGEIELTPLQDAAELPQDSQEEEDNQQQVDDNLMGINLDEDDTQQPDQDDTDKPISAEQLEENAKKRYLTMVIRILRFLQLLCEGHYADLQNNLREQVNQQGIKSARSFDFVAYTSQMFAIYVKSYVNCYSTQLGNQIIETLIELIQGPCRDSQRTLVDTKTIDCCRDLLNQGMGASASTLEQKGFGGKRIEKLNNMKMNSVKLLLSILEGPVDPQISARISQSLGDFGVVVRRMEDVYYQFLEEELNLPPDAPDYRVKKALKKDSFDSCILEGFDIFSLIMQLVEVNPEDVEKLKQFEKEKFYQFYLKNSGNIEVNTEFDILRIYFPLQPKCCFLTEKTKNNFTLKVDRESGQHKLQGLCSWIPTFIEEMEHLEVMSHQYFQITPARLNMMKDVSTFLALAIGGIIIWTYQFDYTELDDEAQLYSAITGDQASQIILVLGSIQMVTSFMLVVGFMVNSASLIVKAGWRDRVQTNEIEMSVEKRELQKMREKSFKELDVKKLEISTLRTILQIEGPYSTVFRDQNGKRNLGGPTMVFEYYWISLTFLISNGTFLFNVMYFVFSVQGLIQSPVFYSFHLLDVINRFEALQNVIKAVTLNVDQILMTSMLGAIIIYNYAIFAFLFLADNLFDSTIEKGSINKAGSSVCMSLLHCYFSTLNYGLRLGGGIGEFMTTTQDPSNEPNLIIWFFFGLTYFLIITTIILNVVFGIIIDSFAQLRENFSNKEEDMKNKCFMCNLDRYTLDRDTEEGFDVHIVQDHDMWDYVYFIIHLKQKDPSDYNGIESHIASMLKAEEIEWFPAHKSIRMNQTLAARKKGDVVQEEEGEIEILQQEMDKFDIALTKFEGMKD